MFTKIDLCLLCLTNYFNLKSILSKDRDGVIIFEKLKFFVSKHIKIEPEESMLYICLPCLEKLNNVYNYKRLCLWNISRLYSFVHKLKTIDEPCSNLQITLIDIQNANINETCGNEFNSNSITTKHCKVDNTNEDETKYGQKPEYIGEILANENNEMGSKNILDNFKKAQEADLIKKEMQTILDDTVAYEFVNEIVIEESEDNSNIIDIKNININKVKCGNELYSVLIKTSATDLICKVDNPNEDETKYGQKPENIGEIANENNEMGSTNILDNFNKAQEADIIKKEMQTILDDTVEYEFVNEIVIEESEDNSNIIDIKNININKVKCGNELYSVSIKTSATDHICKLDNPNEDETKHGQKPENIGEILANENNKVEYTNIFDNIENNKAQEDYFIKQEVLDENEIKYEFIDVIVKEESKDNFDIIDIKSELQSDAFLNETGSNEESTSKTGPKSTDDDVCDKAFSQPSFFENRKRHTGEKPYKCDVCDKAFSVNSSLAKHRRCHTGEKPYKCDICNRAFNQSSILVNHKRCHTGEKPYKCDVCDKAFSRHSILVDHKRLHTGENLYKCDVCNKAFSVRSHLVTHRRCHTGEKPYKCDICSRAFNQISILVSHKRCHTGEKPYKCDVCDKAFSQNSTLIDHKRCHTGEKPYKCDVCDKAFSVNSSLAKHRRCHTGEKPYKCDICNRAFNQSSILVNHKRCHTGEKPYKCDVCDKAFSRHSILVDHKRLHTGENLYKCDVCNKAFSVRSNLVTHRRCHTGEKPYKCDICSRAFNQISILVSHKRCHIGEKPYKCDVCDKAFSRNSTLIDHKRCHTG